jgi:hypothetical protein
MSKIQLSLTRKRDVRTVLGFERSRDRENRSPGQLARAAQSADPTAAKNPVAFVQHDRLTRSDAVLRFVELYAESVFG